MFSEDFSVLPVADQNDFAHVVNKLLLKGFIVRDIYSSKDKENRTSNEYRFLDRYFDLVNDYLSYSDWAIEQDALKGVIFLINKAGENRIKMDRLTSLIIFALRSYYEEELKNGLNSEQKIYMTTNQLIVYMHDKGILIPGKVLRGRGIASPLRFLTNHNIINKVSGSYDNGDVSFYLLPSIIYAVSNEKIVEMSKVIDELNSREDSNFGGNL